MMYVRYRVTHASGYQCHDWPAGVCGRDGAAVVKQRANKVPLPGKIPQQMVLDFASTLRHDHFRASAGWLSSFKARHGIVARTISAEAAGVDVVATS